MDKATIIIGIVILIICILPFFLGTSKNKKAAKKHLDQLTGFAKESGGNISQHESWQNTIIGLDEKSKFLYFIRSVNEIDTKNKVDLIEIKKCTVITIRSTFNSNIEKLFLSFEFKNKSNAEIKLEFFDSEFDGLNITGQLQIATKWGNSINGIVSAL